VAVEGPPRLSFRRDDDVDARHGGKSRGLSSHLESKSQRGTALGTRGSRVLTIVGVTLDLAIAKYAGKGQGEVTLLRQLSTMFSRGNVLLADCLMCNWRNFHELTERGVHVVTRLNRALRQADFRKGERLGPDDHVVQWPKPHIREVGRAAQRAMPRYLTVREARVYVKWRLGKVCDALTSNPESMHK